MESDINKIRTICDKYFDGETSAEEEAALKEYFSRTIDIPDDLRAVKVMICGFSDAATLTYDSAPPPSAVSRRKGLVVRIIWGTIATAASIAICISLFTQEIYGYDSDGKAITDPEAALEGAKYLSYLSKLETTIDIAQIISLEMEENN